MGQKCTTCVVRKQEAPLPRGTVVFKGDTKRMQRFSNNDHLDANWSVLRVWIYSCEELAADLAGDADGLADPYVKMYLNDDEVVLPDGSPLGDQLQQTSTVHGTLTPIWRPAEEFMFMLPKSKKKIKLLFEVMDKDVRSSHDILGSAMLKIGDCKAGKEEKVLTLNRPGSHETTGSLKFAVELFEESQEAFDTYEDILVENERWQASGWGHTFPGHFLPTDKVRRYSSVCQKFTHQEFKPVVEWVEKQREGDFEPLEHWHFVNVSGDPDGWEYGFSFETSNWKDDHDLTTPCRRRFWRRMSKVRRDKRRPSVMTEANMV